MKRAFCIKRSKKFWRGAESDWRTNWDLHKSGFRHVLESGCPGAHHMNDEEESVARPKLVSGSNNYG